MVPGDRGYCLQRQLWLHFEQKIKITQKNKLRTPYIFILQKIFK